MKKRVTKMIAHHHNIKLAHLSCTLVKRNTAAVQVIDMNTSGLLTHSGDINIIILAFLCVFVLTIFGHKPYNV